MNDKEFYINWLNSLDFDKEDKKDEDIAEVIKAILKLKEVKL
ncbi:MAG: hypothetical protein QXI58_01045 [Candidatus Micrarchaeia archaeon]